MLTFEHLIIFSTDEVHVNLFDRFVLWFYYTFDSFYDLNYLIQQIISNWKTD